MLCIKALHLLPVQRIPSSDIFIPRLSYMTFRLHLILGHMHNFLLLLLLFILLLYIYLLEEH